MSGESERVERIGLLFVHGIGEQRRFEHLTGSVAELAEQFRNASPQARVSLVDRTPGWQPLPGEQDPGGAAPITLSVRSPDASIDFECFEVWWADLGSRSGVLESVGFWLWGLGQWAAPIYREVDASRLDKDARDNQKPVASLARCPSGIAGDLRKEPWARLKLLVAAVAAAFAAVTLSLAKRIAGALSGRAPSPTIIVQYVGDVRTYTEPGRPGAGATSDPGQPRRVAIRRRMVREMMALAAKPLDGWFVLAHSLGTVVAYNGLTEIGHTLPNYLSEDSWRRLPERLRRDDGVRLRRDIENMMPARPAWLDDGDAINRVALFSNLRGLFTYGSPLGKFAALWPRIVATATDRVDREENPFPEGCRWVNFAAPHDPVAGILTCFPAEREGDLFFHSLPRIENVRTPLGFDFGLSHIRYLAGEERFAAGKRVTQKMGLSHWLLGRYVGFGTSASTLMQRLALAAGYLLIINALWLLAILVFTGVRSMGWALSTDGTDGPFAVSLRFLSAAEAVAFPILGTVVGLVTLSGLLRWHRESRHNLALAAADMASDAGNLEKYWNKVTRMLGRHAAAAATSFAIGAPMILASLVAEWSIALDLGQLPLQWPVGVSPALSLTVAILASLAQTLISRSVKSVKDYR